MGLIDNNGTRLGPDDGEPDIVILGMDDIQELRRIADAVELQAKLAKKEAKQAKKTAFWSKIFSTISIAIALGSLIVAILALAFR